MFDGRPVERSSLLEIWREVLVAATGLDPTEAVVAELADYFEISVEEARERSQHYASYSAEEWDDGDRTTPDGLIDYWNRHSPVFGILMSHALQYTEEHPAVCIDIAEVLADMPTGRLLDYGVGPATSSLFFERLGWSVTGADVSTTMLDFATWRAQRRGSECTFIDLRDGPPPSGFDVVLALEVMAHVPDIKATLNEMREALKPGGLLIFNVYAPPATDELKGHLFVGNYHVIRHIRSSGFKRHPRIGKYYMYERVEHSPWQRRAANVTDNLRHNRVVSDVAQLVRRAIRRLSTSAG